MAYTCYKCLKPTFSTLKLLWDHLKWWHSVTTRSKTKIVCSQRECKLTYYSGYTYKRHLQAAHGELENQAQNNLVEADDDIGVEQAIYSPEDSPSATDDDRDEPDTEEIIKDIQHSTSQYVLHLKSSKIPASTFQYCLNTSRDFIVNIVDRVQKAAGPILEDEATGTHPAK